MGVSLSLESLSLNAVAFTVDPLAELGAFLHAFTHPDHHILTGKGADLEAVSANERLLARAEYFRPLYGNIRSRFLLPLHRNHGESAIEHRIAEIGTLEIAEFVAMSAATLLEVESTAFADSLLDDSDSRERFLRSLRNLSMSRLEFARNLLDDPERERRQFQVFLAEIVEKFFGRFWGTGGLELQEEAYAQQRLLSEQGFTALTELAPGSHLLPEPHTLVFDKVNHAHVAGVSELLVTPSFFLGPHLILKSDAGYPALLQYDLRAKNYDTVTSISRRIASLTDPTRLQICRSLLREPRTTTELAQKLEITVPQASRHLRALRENQVVQGRKVGRNTYYLVDLQRVRRLGLDLLAALYK